MMKTHACLQNMNQNENKNNVTLLLKNMTDINKIYLRRKSDIWHLIKSGIPYYMNLYI